MSLFGSLYTGAAGMNAQTNSTAVISENIANMTTVGYKRTSTAFQDFVNSNKSTVNGSGSVGTTRVNRISQQGNIQQTASGKDLAINGNGFFVVRADATDPLSPDLYTRNGQFENDVDGYLKNSAGFTLFGWAYDDLGVLDPSTLVPIDVDLLSSTSRPTSAAEIALNLDATQVPYDPHVQTPAQELPVDNLATHFARSLTVYDGNGAARQLAFEFRRTVGPMAHFTSDTGPVMDYDDVLVDNPSGPTPGITAGDTLELDSGTDILTITFVNGAADTSINEANTLRDVIDVIHNHTDVSGTRLYTTSLTSDGRLLVQANNPNSTIDITTSSASVLGATGLNIIQDPDSADYTYDRDARLTVNGAANPEQTNFPSFVDTGTPNPYGWWELSIKTVDPADPTGSTLVEVSKGLLNFNSDGSLNATLDANGQALIDLPAINFDITDATETISMTVDIANFTQFAGVYTVGYTDQNGAPLGTLVDTEITNEGDVLSVFSNGIRLEAFRIPLAIFVNADGLGRIDGTAFTENDLSGAPTLLDPTTGGAGLIQAASLENSNVEIAQEFSSLIVSQRAFSLNSQLINAVDEMTQTLARISA